LTNNLTEHQQCIEAWWQHHSVSWTETHAVGKLSLVNKMLKGKRYVVCKTTGHTKV